MERGLLSNPALERHHDDVVWMYLFQDFSHSDSDRAAERVALRFGISSWPQHKLIDPADLSILGDTGRTLETFGRAVAAAPSFPREAQRIRPSIEDLRTYDALAERLQTGDDLDLARGSLDHPDRVVRYCAVTALAGKDPNAVVAAARDLLAVPHDQLRYAVLKVLAVTGDRSFARDLDRLLANPEPSHNSNVLRQQTAHALMACGDGESLPGLRAFVVGGSPNNALTHTSILAVGAIGVRDAQAAAAARAILVDGLPAPFAPSDSLNEKHNDSAQARVVRLARAVHHELTRVTGSEQDFPDSGAYDRAARERLLALWRE